MLCISQTRQVKASTRVEAVKNLVECQHQAHALLLEADGTVIFETVEPQGLSASEFQTFARSCAKPVQAWPLLLAAQKAGLTLPQQALAIACASHSAAPEHLQWVNWWLNKAGLNEIHLQCGHHLPLDETSAREWLKNNDTVGCALHHNCSGKHAAMLWACQTLGFPLNSYLEPEHPYQQLILQGYQRFGNLKASPPLAIDGCSLPAPWVSLQTLAHWFAALLQAPELAPIKAAMQAHPFLVAGPNRLDTLLAEVSEGVLLSKVGADGLICVANTQQKRVLVLKVLDGNTAVRDAALIQLLVKHAALEGWLSLVQIKRHAKSHPVLLQWVAGVRLNAAGLEVGSIVLEP